MRARLGGGGGERGRQTALLLHVLADTEHKVCFEKGRETPYEHVQMNFQVFSLLRPPAAKNWKFLAVQHGGAARGRVGNEDFFLFFEFLCVGNELAGRLISRCPPNLT